MQAISALARKPHVAKGYTCWHYSPAISFESSNGNMENIPRPLVHNRRSEEVDRSRSPRVCTAPDRSYQFEGAPKRLAGEGNAELPFNLITWLPQSFHSFLPSFLPFLLLFCLFGRLYSPKRSSPLHHKAGCCAKSSPREHIGCYCRGAAARTPPRPARRVGAIVNRKKKKRGRQDGGFSFK